jgi:transposase
MASILLLPDPAVLALVSVEVNEETKMIEAFVKTTGSVAHCPVCGHAADRVHSHYVRILADLPCSGQQVRFLVQVRRFWCKNTACKRDTYNSLDVSHERNSGWPSLREQKGHGMVVVLVGVTSDQGVGESSTQGKAP